VKNKALPIADCQLPIERRGDGEFRIPIGNWQSVIGNSSSPSAFTLLELLVVVIIIVVLACIVVPLVMRSHRTNHMLVEKFDFQAIDAALQAYHADFGDYPRNRVLPRWNTMRGGASSPPTPAPVFYSLAVALLGPGPGVTQTVNGDLQAGDGHDGLGFRCPSVPQVSGTAAATQGSAAMTMTIDSADNSRTAEFVRSFAGAGSANATLASVTLFPSDTQPFQETIGISRVSLTGDQLELTLKVAPSYPHDGRCEITVADGKVWGPYLAANAVKVSFVPSVDSYGAPFAEFGQPVLVDRWGQVIEYFPRYGAASNRTGDSTYPPDVSVQAGPLFGYSQPKSVDGVNGQNAMFDWRDGAPYFTISGQVGPAQSWPKPVSGGATNSLRPELAIEWMLGEPEAGGDFKNEIGAGQKLNFDGPYILISAGPEGPDRPLGGFCNFADWQNGDNPLPEKQLQQAFTASGNIYNFERP
jgi:prepilin-type N-terminal cleavage/methylation domain-containing protein